LQDEGQFMQIHHLNCVSSCPIGGALMDGRSSLGLRGRLACHCLVVETPRGLVLVDTGFGLRDVAHPRARLSPFFRELLAPELREEMTAIRQIQRLGLDPRDVRHVVLTHLDFDHAGGLDDFPWAEVHLLADEVRSATAQATVLDRMRYRPAQWSTRENWRTYRPRSGESWFGFECVRDLHGLPPEILLVPLVGHTLGHAGIAVRRDRDWLLMAGDAYFYFAEMEDPPRCTPGLRLYQTMMEKDRRARLGNQRRLRALCHAHGDEVIVTCGHDVTEFEHLAGRPLAIPAATPSRLPALEGPEPELLPAM
jgi:glyoxylase-like metal-dependent hydrolase (beta-lactamase superfamily II)